MKTLGRLALCAVLLACGRDSTGPAEPTGSLSVRAGADQYALPGSELEYPLEVIVNRPGSGDPIDDIEVQWRVASGSGAVLTSSSSRTDGRGVATTRLKLGDASGTYVVEASTRSMASGPARFEAFAVTQPVVTSITPARAAAGETIVITGQHFGSGARVVIDGLRARVTSASATELRAVVPPCAATTQADVVVAFGPVASSPVSLATSAEPRVPLDLAVGEARTLAADALECVAFPGSQGFFVAVQNSARTWGPRLRYELGAELEDDVAVTTRTAAVSDFEGRLRAHEAQLRGPLAARAPFEIASAIPEVGERRTFSVLEPDLSFTEVTAEVSVVSRHAIVYTDVEAPNGGFTTAQLAELVNLFDNLIYPTQVDVFGAPSDLDANQRVIILFTPRVNALTARGSSSFIAGYFYGCDLLEKQRCSGSNRGEVFYSMVPDGTGQFGDVRPTATVLENVPAVLAHEMQHMISFARRGGTLDALWLSEALAHEAERQVADAARATSPETARLFDLPNRVRARAYLSAPENYSLLGPQSPGTIGFRGGAWLLLRHLMGHHGGKTLLRQLSDASSSGVANVESATGRVWADILADFAIALWASDASVEPQLRDERHRFTNLDLRAEFGQAGTSPLYVETLPRTFFRAGELEAASHTLFLVPPDAQSIKRRVRLQGWDGAELESAAAAQMMVLRYQ